MGMMVSIRLIMVMNELALFAGVGGGLLGSKILGWRTVCAVENNPYRICRLMQRQNEGFLEPFPIWDDVRTFDGRLWRGVVDVVSGGFPCQDISIAGKGAGIDGERSGLWREMARIIGEVRPRYAFVENSQHLVRRGLDRVLSDFAEMGYDAKWGIVSAENAGAPHERKRCFVLAYTKEKRNGMLSIRSRRSYKGKIDFAGSGSHLSNADTEGLSKSTQKGLDSVEEENGSSARPESGRVFGKNWRSWPYESGLGRVVSNGMAGRMVRVQAIGDGQVPRVVALAWRVLTGE